jgi:hypothetical protein
MPRRHRNVIFCGVLNVTAGAAGLSHPVARASPKLRISVSDANGRNEAPAFFEEQPHAKNSR